MDGVIEGRLEQMRGRSKEKEKTRWAGCREDSRGVLWVDAGAARGGDVSGKEGVFSGGRLRVLLCGVTGMLFGMGDLCRPP
jgi:hypothetical protein